MASGTEEKRHHPRKKASLPAFVVVPGSHAVHPAMIHDISCGGVRLFVSKESGAQMLHFERQLHLNILFALPQHQDALAMHCMPSRVLDRDEQIEVGAFFTSLDVAGFQNLQNYLLDPSAI